MLYNIDVVLSGCILDSATSEAKRLEAAYKGERGEFGQGCESSYLAQNEECNVGSVTVIADRGFDPRHLGWNSTGTGRASVPVA